MRAMRVIVISVVMVLTLTGCSGREEGLLLSAEEARVTPCTGLESITVEDLDTDALPDCEPRGVDLVFPDGTRADLPDIDAGAGSGSTMSSGDDGVGDTYGYTYVGIFGLHATQSSPDCSRVKEWGTAEARLRVRHAFGADFPCE